MEANASNWLSLWIARTTATLEAVHGARSGASHDTACERALVESIESLRREGAMLPAVVLRSRLGLTVTEERVFWLLVAAELSTKVRDLASLTSGSSQPTVSMLLETIYGGTTSVIGWSELAPAARLRSLGLVLRSDSGDENTPDALQMLRASARARAVALGQLELPDELGFATLNPDVIPLDDVAAEESVKQQVAALVTRPSALLLVTGSKGTGKATLVRSAARAAGLTLLQVDAARIATNRETARAMLTALAREARLHDAAVLICDVDELAEDGPSVDDRLDLLDIVLQAGCQVFATASVRSNGMNASRPIVCIEMAPITTAQRRHLWKRAIPTAADADVEFLASTYALAPSMIHAVGRALVARCDEQPSADEVLESIEGVVDDNLRGLADRIVTTQTWDDLVLPDDQLQSIEELIARVRQRGRVYETWGFANKLGKGLGVAALLSGPPGTGKTMLAGLIAKELGLSLYQVDLSKMVSKWIGETEKNLARLFDAAEAGHAVLLFDEADSMFGKRTDVKSSNDRNANLEVNYLLQRIERFTGICLLTSNHESSIDAAFRRRLAFHIRFDTPDESERAHLWRALLPTGAPVASDVDFAALARKFEMAGGHIRNAVLRAAFLASDAGSSITMNHLWRSALTEYEALGKISYSAVTRLRG